MQKKTPLLTQMLIYSVILLVSEGISLAFNHYVPKFPLPMPLVALVLLFCLLIFGVIKLPQIESVGNFLLDYLGLFFVPAGIALITELEELQANGLKIVIVIIASTVLMLGLTAGITALLIEGYQLIKNKLER